MRILWCITGAGHLLEETVEVIEKKSKKDEITVVYSTAGFEVACMYGVEERIKKAAYEIIYEKDQGKSSPFIGRLPRKEYDKVVVAPCTANTTAKIAYGIADSLITNIVAQAGKAKIPLYVLPTDGIRRQTTRIPATVNLEKCRNCRSCPPMKKCRNKAVIYSDRVRIDLMKCVGCRRCVDACTYKAIEFGKEVVIECRDIDLENAARLSRIPGLKPIRSLEELI